MNTAPNITTVQVCQSLGIRPDRKQAWAIGGIVTRMYRHEEGAEPVKLNRRKTSGPGSHCFAVYPLNWYERIAGVVRQVTGPHDAQPDLFGGES